MRSAAIDASGAERSQFYSRDTGTFFFTLVLAQAPVDHSKTLPAPPSTCLTEHSARRGKQQQYAASRRLVTAALHYVLACELRSDSCVAECSTPIRRAQRSRAARDDARPPQRSP